MPSVSGKQHRFMEMVAHEPGAAKRVGVPKSVGEDFAKADEGKHFKGRKYPGMGEHHVGGHQHGHPGRMEKLRGKGKTSAERSHKHRHGKDGRY